MVTEFTHDTVYMAIVEMDDPKRPYIELPVMVTDIIEGMGLAEVVEFDLVKMEWDHPDDKGYLVPLDNLSEDRGRALEYINRAKEGMANG